MSSSRGIRRNKNQTVHPIRILIADDHALFRDGLQKIFESCPNIDVVGQAVDGPQAVQFVRELEPDILLLDLGMSGLEGLQVLRRIGRISGVRTIILTSEISAQDTASAFRLGASAVVTKESSPTDVLDCIVAVHDGKPWNRHEDAIGPAGASLVTADTAGLSKNARLKITKRETEVIEAILAACSNKEIAAKLSISEQTVKHHLSNIFDKIGVSTRLELALYARQNGFMGAAPQRVESDFSIMQNHVFQLSDAPAME